MTSAYFKEPTGIHRCNNGFATGSHMSAIGSDFILFVHEFNIFNLLLRFSFLKFIERYNRLRDDLALKITGTLDQVADVLHVIFTNYPSGLEFTVTSNIKHSKVLDTRLISCKGRTSDIMTILRKSPNKFDIIQHTSNTNTRYKSSAANHYIDRINSVCNYKPEKYKQRIVTKLILNYKGISMPRKRIPKVMSQQIRKKFCSTIIHDQQSNSHGHIKSFLKKCKYPKSSYYYPADIPGKKLKAFIFTKHKLVKALWN